MCVQLLQPWLTLWDPVDYSPPGSSVHEILQARILEWVTMPSSRESSWLRDWSSLLRLLHWKASLCIYYMYIQGTCICIIYTHLLNVHIFVWSTYIQTHTYIMQCLIWCRLRVNIQSMHLLFVLYGIKRSSKQKSWIVSRSQQTGMESHFCFISVHKRFSGTIYFPLRNGL